MEIKGQHAILDAWLADWPGDDAILAACERAIDACGMHVECSTVKRFAPSGVTAVWILSESHFTAHTYPEYAYLSVDCYTCGSEGDPGAAIAALRDLLSIKRLKYSLNSRGVLPTHIRGPKNRPTAAPEA
ncbi:MAG: adenosylmethionine decarboxylase [Sulfitobacter sp.]|uniref:adenosylmethionine decarboxylase n=1 Tax=Sphingomonas sp. TaxID=28214 RepID=UPI002585A016|nr:adenosylmethionine decarboxylase [Sphingomonas sp.]MCP3883436.1 adenosylmethionine decarboxylase [Sulfitobacter sp.]MCP4025081.1 adenosylmethionine decarboxylase [Sphingomonas sp.]